MKSAWTGLEEALRALRVTIKICPPLSSAVDDLVSCLPIFEAAAKNRSDYDELATGLKSTVHLLIRHLNDTVSEETVNAIAGTANSIRDEIESINRNQSSSRPCRILGALNAEDDLLRRYRRIEQLFRQLQGEASLSTWNTVNELMINEHLKSLRPAKLARFDSGLSTEVSRRACTKNTRTRILEDSAAWSEDPRLAKIYWMKGMAGTGKTTIAYTFCERLKAGQQLAASFFCMRASPECREAKRIIPTISYQLARRLAPFRYSLCQQLKQDPDISTGRLSDQFDLLLKKPLLEAKDKLSDNLVIVVDALDECNDPHIVELFLGLLLDSAVELPVKFFTTSRPEPIIRNKMIPQSERSRSILYLHEIEQTLVQADIELYLREELDHISPADGDIKELAHRAGKLFIYAATAARYIRPAGRVVNSQARLAAILALSTDSKRKLSAIDALYSAILVEAIENEQLECEERDQIRLVLWTVICACEPILINTLSVLCGLNDKNTTMIALQPLRSVLHVSDDSEFVTTLHASFPDYMLAQERSGAFFCDKSTHSRLLSERCLKIMQAQLRFNICSIDSSFIPDDEIPGLEERIRANISEELFYACRFWVNHFTQANNPETPLVHDFLSRQLLFWMEVLNLKKCMVLCATSINKLNIRLMQAGEGIPRGLLKFAADSLNFVCNYAACPASSRTPHIYLSALPFSPPSSSLRSCYLPRFKGLVTVSGTSMEKLLQATLGTWQLTFRVCSVAFSPDGDRIVLGGDQGELCVQSAYNGNYVFRPFKAHEKAIASLGFSRDDLQIVSGSDDTTFSVWSAQNGSLISGPFEGHSERVTSVEFSPDGTHIVSGSGDCNVGVSVAYNPTIPMRRFTGHTGPVESVSFSPDGVNVISGSSDGTARIWDVLSGATIRIFPLRQLDHISVRFLRNGLDFVAGAIDHLVFTWNGPEGTLRAGPPKNAHEYYFDYGPVTSICISPEGSFIASGSRVGTISVWPIQGDGLAATSFQDHTAPVNCIGFCNDSSRMISASDDNTIRIWDVRSRMELADITIKTWSFHVEAELAIVPTVYLERPSMIASSPDNAQVAIHRDSSIYIWDLRKRTYATILSYSWVDCIFLQYSLDGTRIFTMYNRGEIYTWDAHTAQLVDGPHQLSTHEPIYFAVCSADGTRIVIKQEGHVELWDVQSNRLVAVCPRIDDHGHGRSYPLTFINKIIFALKSKSFLTTTTVERLPSSKLSTINIWDSDSGRLVAGPFEIAKDSYALDISPDGMCIAYCDHGVDPVPIRLIDVSTQSDISMPLNKLPLNEHDLFGHVSAKFTPDGDYLASSIGGTCYIWNIRDQTVVTALTTIPEIRSITYSVDGWCLATSHIEEKLQILRFHVDDFPEPATITEDGWVLDSRSRLLFWVLKDIRDEFPKRSGISVWDGKVMCGVDYSDMVVGDR
ncbi:hypothetical protein OPQ81_009109 [Rhizoctonia solani]|nr:hypothetical protein OPQ81_009109 [Rhizoctonia solani]